MANQDPPVVRPSGYTEQIPLAICEVALIVKIRELGYGELCIKVQGGRPVMIERGIEQIRLV